MDVYTYGESVEDESISPTSQKEMVQISRLRKYHAYKSNLIIPTSFNKAQFLVPSVVSEWALNDNAKMHRTLVMVELQKDADIQRVA